MATLTLYRDVALRVIETQKFDIGYNATDKIIALVTDRLNADMIYLRRGEMNNNKRMIAGVIPRRTKIRGKMDFLIVGRTGFEPVTN